MAKKKKIEQLRRQIKADKSLITSTNLHHASLQKNYDSALQQNNNYKKEIDELSATNKLMAMQLESLQKELKVAKETNNAIMETNTQLEEKLVQVALSFIPKVLLIIIAGKCTGGKSE